MVLKNILKNISLAATVLVVAVATLLSACKKESEVSNPQQALYDDGKVIYMSRCIACHNPDPHQVGSVGPDVYGSSRELIEARVLRAEYPTGYKPKRETHLMVALPDLKDKVEALYSFLNSK